MVLKDEHKVFGFTTEKDENEMLRQLKQAYSQGIIASSATLNIFDINYAFTCVEALFMNFKKKLKPETVNRISSLINDYKRQYAAAIGIIGHDDNQQHDNYTFLFNLNENVKSIYVIFNDGL